jgi:uncharacterized protein (UPF0262 family)
MAPNSRGFAKVNTRGKNMSGGQENSGTSRLVNINLDERTVVRRSADVEHERAVAMFDLLDRKSVV